MFAFLPVWTKVYICTVAFLLGAVLGRVAYRQKQTLLPNVNPEGAVIRFFRFCGTHSLLIYMVHQPLLAGAVGLIAML